jgi:hypothetical protein
MTADSVAPCATSAAATRQPEKKPMSQPPAAAMWTRSAQDQIHRDGHAAQALRQGMGAGGQIDPMDRAIAQERHRCRLWNEDVTHARRSKRPGGLQLGINCGPVPCTSGGESRSVSAVSAVVAGTRKGISGSRVGRALGGRGSAGCPRERAGECGPPSRRGALADRRSRVVRARPPTGKVGRLFLCANVGARGRRRSHARTT